MLLPKNKYRAFGYFGMAIFYFAVFTIQVLTGMIPRGTGDPAKYYAENTGFFWTYITIMFLVMLYNLIRGIYLYVTRVRRDTDLPKAAGFTPRTACIITSAVAIPFGLLLFILPVVELAKGTAYGGYALGTHSLAAAAPAFWAVLIFQVVVAGSPVLGGAMLLFFPPRNVDAVVQAEPIASPLGIAPTAGMKTGTKVLIGFGVAALLLVVLVTVGLVGGVYYVLKRVEDPEMRRKVEVAKTAGTEFGRNTDQNGCMDKAYTLEAPVDSFDLSSGYFTKSCLKASRPTPNFCDGVPFTLDRDWFDKQCDVPGRPRKACVIAYSEKRDFCRLD